MNRWYFWMLAPVMLAGAAIIPMTAAPSTSAGWLVAYGISLVLVLATIGLASPVRCAWALRAVAGLVAVAAVAYFVDELHGWINGRPLGAFGPRSRHSLWNAGLFLLLVGVPALRYLLSGSGPGDEIDVEVADGDTEEEFAGSEEIFPVRRVDSADFPDKYPQIRRE